MPDWYNHLHEIVGEDPFNLFLAYVGTFAGAISGVRLASVKRFDWFGAFVVGFVTALGGGTLRDFCLNTSPFWMKEPSYIVVTFSACVAVAFFGRRFISEKITWFIFDTIAISLFTVFGLEKTLYGPANIHFAWWAAIMMGVITAVFGGVLRDILINEVPLIFRKELYAMACTAGAFIYIILYWLNVHRIICSISCILVIFLLRALAIKYGWSVPVLKGHAYHFGRGRRHHR